MNRPNYEQMFTAKYPHANVRAVHGKPYEMVAVYAGDYLCAEGHTKRQAFKTAWLWEQQGLITPDPEERRSDEEFIVRLAQSYATEL